MNDIGYLVDGFRELDPDSYPYNFERAVEAGCGHEVFPGELLFFWDDPQTLCPECIAERFDALSITEKAELLGSDWTEI